MKNMAFVEYVVADGLDIGAQCQIGLFDVSEIVSIVSVSRSDDSEESVDTSRMSLRGGRDYYIRGGYRQLVNRWMYGVTAIKRGHALWDSILRPSDAILNRPESISIDKIHFDAYQLFCFVRLVNPSLLAASSEGGHQDAEEMMSVKK